MAKFCINCGYQMEDSDNACANCGTFANQQQTNYYNQNMVQQPYINQQNMYYQNVPGQPNYVNYNVLPANLDPNNLYVKKAQTSKILGIIACIWCVLMILALTDTSSLEMDLADCQTISEKIGYTIGYTLFSLIPSIIGLTKALKSKKAVQNNDNKLGLILNVIALTISIIIFVYLSSLY